MFEVVLAIVIVCLLVTILWSGGNAAINLKVNRLANDFHTIQLAIYDSQAGGRQMHGKVHKASLTLQDSAAAGDNGNRNAIIDGNWNSTSGAVFSLWKNPGSAGLKQGETSSNPDSYVPLKSHGTGIRENYSALIAGLKGDYIICTSNLAGRLAKELDLVMDDGNTVSGPVMVSGSIGGTAVATDSIDNRAAYTVCFGI